MLGIIVEALLVGAALEALVVRATLEALLVRETLEALPERHIDQVLLAIKVLEAWQFTSKGMPSQKYI